MIVSAEEAVNIYNCLPVEMRSYYFHPQYVINDANSKEELQPIFFANKKTQRVFSITLFILEKVPNSSYKDIQSPYGYGGPIMFGEVSFIEKCIEEYKKMVFG
ncbi:hypothetical protein ACFTAO_43500 [Paenibacillus rhizoplanae]